MDAILQLGGDTIAVDVKFVPPMQRRTTRCIWEYPDIDRTEEHTPSNSILYGEGLLGEGSRIGDGATAAYERLVA